MRNNAITRIIVFSIVIVILLGILLAGLGFGMFMVHFGTSASSHSVGSEGGSFYGDDIRNLNIEWAAGNISIESADTDYITFSEEGRINAKTDQMIWEQHGNTLTIRYSEPTVKIGVFSSSPVKNLTIIVPEDWSCDQLDLEAASADLQIQELEANKVEISTASGNCDLINCMISDLDVDTASGSVHYTGWLDTLDCDAASAGFEGIFTNTPSKIAMDSVSGDLDLTFPEGCGFRVNMDALSGEFYSDLNVQYDGSRYTYGDQKCIIEFDGVSGSVQIREK